MRRLLSSPRRRRRLAWLTVVALVAGIGAFVGIHYSNTGDRLESPITKGGPVFDFSVPKTVKATPREKREASILLGNFIATAVLRRHVGQSFDMTGPTMRQGYTRAQWSTGNNPIVPFPAKDVGLVKAKLTYQLENRLGYEVAIFAKRGASVHSQLFAVELVGAGKGKQRHWLVDTWLPTGDPRPVGSTGTYVAKRPLGSIWLLVPVSFVGVIFLLPLLVWGREWRRNRAVDRAYRRGAGALPPMR